MDGFGQVYLDDEAHRLLFQLLPFEGPPWSALDALDAMTDAQARGDLEAALRESEILRDQAPSWAEGRRRRLQLLVHGLRDPDAATADIDSIPGGTLPEDELRRERQTVALLRDDWVAYAEAQTEMIRDGARQSSSWEVLGLAWWGAGQLERALVAIEEGLQDHPGNRELELRKAEVLEAMGRHVEALAHFERLVGIDPPHPKTLALRGWTRRLDNPVGAAADWEAALSLDPEQPVARVGRGLMRLKEGDLAGARTDLEPFQFCGWTEAADAWAHFLSVAGEEPEPHAHRH